MSTSDINHPSVIDLEAKKFATRDSDGKVVVRVSDETASASDPLAGLNVDSYRVTDNTLSDVVEYFEGGLGGTLLATFTRTYTTPRKTTEVSGVWTYP